MSEPSEQTFQLVRTVGLAAALVLAVAIERFRPHERMRTAWRTNLGLWAVDAGLMTFVCGACGWVVAGWAAERELGLLGFVGAGPWLGIGVGLVGLDAVSYFWHRANHQLPLLWRFHRVHHADTSFHVTTALRFHPGELMLALPVRLAAIVLLGVPAVGVLVFEVVFGIANLLVHGNLDLPARVDPLVRRLLITPALHRAHHSADWHELNTNFGTVFSIWDRLGRTFRASDPARRVTTGLPDRDGDHAPTLAESLWLPFAGDGRRAR